MNAAAGITSIVTLDTWTVPVNFAGEIEVIATFGSNHSGSPTATSFGVFIHKNGAEVLQNYESSNPSSWFKTVTIADQFPVAAGDVVTFRALKDGAGGSLAFDAARSRYTVKRVG